MIKKPKIGAHQKVLALMVLTILFFSAFSWGFGSELIDDIEEVREITILETSDLHGFIYPYNYKENKEDLRGFAKVATVIKEERQKNPNLLLVDCGDTIQGNYMGSFRNYEPNPMIEALNMLDYDIWVLGNHEFNFGLAPLEKAMYEFEGQVLTGNIYKENNTYSGIDFNKEKEYLEKPYIIKNQKGIRIAFYGMTAPHVPMWEEKTPDHVKNLEFRPIMEETGKILSELTDRADVIIGAVHYGLDTKYGPYGMEDVADVYGYKIDGLLLGHSHIAMAKVLDSKVPMVMPGKQGSHVGKLTIRVKKTEDKWQVIESIPEIISTENYAPDLEILEKFKYVHNESLEK